jgi:hypothetical protein
VKTIYTDRYAIRLWIFALLTISMGYKGLIEDSGWLQILSIIAASYWAYSAAKEFRRRKNARRSGSDPSVYKVVDNAPNK